MTYGNRGNSLPSPSTNALAACPICGKPEAGRYRPFCSARCQEVDLGRWLKGGYRVPTEERPEGSVGEPEDNELAGRE